MSRKLVEILFKNYRRRVLALLLLNPQQRFHVREIARLTGTQAGTLHKELVTLAEAGVLVKEPAGNQVVYQANPACPVIAELTSILEKTCREKTVKAGARSRKMGDIVEKYRRQILALARENGVRNVRVFGSMARNEANKDSDLDLLVDLESGQSGLALGGFLSDVTDLVQRKVDVVTEKSLHPKIKEKVLQEAITL